jgi:uncharacterized membrane protein (DUF485 family)
MLSEAFNSFPLFSLQVQIFILFISILVIYIDFQSFIAFDKDFLFLAKICAKTNFDA